MENRLVPDQEHSCLSREGNRTAERHAPNVHALALESILRRAPAGVYHHRGVREIAFQRILGTPYNGTKLGNWLS